MFNHGRIEQIGSPTEIYDRPATAFVAGFVGVSNLIAGDAAVRILGERRAFTVRPERIRIANAGTTVPTDSCGTAGTVAGASFLGATTRYRIDIGDQTELSVIRQNSEGLPTGEIEVGQRVQLIWQRRQNNLLADGGQ